MGKYGNMEIAIPGLISEGIQASSIRSRSAMENIAFGVPVFAYLGEANKVWNYHLDTSKVVYSADFSSSNVISLSVNGEAISAVTYGVGHAETIAALVLAVKALTITDVNGDDVDVDCVLDATDTSSRTILIRAKGAELTVTSSVAGGSAVTVGITYRTDLVFAGISVYTQKDIATANVGTFLRNQAVSIMEKGIIYAYVNGTPVADEIAYVDNAGADKGRFAISGDTVGCYFRSDKITNADTTDTIAMIEVKGIYKSNAEVAW